MHGYRYFQNMFGFFLNLGISGSNRSWTEKRKEGTRESRGREKSVQGCWSTDGLVSHQTGQVCKMEDYEWAWLTLWGNWCNNIGPHILSASGPWCLTWRCPVDATAFLSQLLVLICIHWTFFVTSCSVLLCFIVWKLSASLPCHMVDGIGWNAAIHSGKAQICWQNDGFLPL